MTQKLQKTPNTRTLQKQSETPRLTLSDHLAELRNRLIWIAAAFLLGTGIAYPFFHQITYWLMKPIGSEKLYYTTPAGGISFIIKICMYVGFLFVLPAIIYHVYQFVVPVMAKHRARSIAGYTIASFILAIVGVAFAYFVSLPSALHFLTGIQLGNIHALISVDSYLSFITAYLVAGALLFQVLLVMLIIDSITPLPPKKLVGYQRYNIVIAFIVAALITPTPDVVNQAMIAGPMILMYQLAVILIWFRHRRAGTPEPEIEAMPTFRAMFQSAPAANRTSIASITETLASDPETAEELPALATAAVLPEALDIKNIPRILQPAAVTVPQQNSTDIPAEQPSTIKPGKTRNIDGFFRPATI